MYAGVGEFQYVAAYVVQVLEFLETFDQELEWIWRKRWSWITCVFLFARYGSLAIQAIIVCQQLYATVYPQTHEQCFKWILLRTFTPSVFLACIHITLITRVYALYNRNRWLLFLLVLLLFSENAFIITLFTRMLSRTWEENSRCELQRVSDQTMYLWMSILPLCLDLIILILTIKRVLLFNRRVHPMPILRTVIVDGTWAVFVIWSSVIAAIILSVCGYIQACNVISNSWMTTVMSFAVTRTVLNVRKYSAPTLRQLDRGEARTEEDNVALTAYIYAEGTLTLRRENSFA